MRVEHEVAQQEAQFLLSLPPKARNFHFSREEQVLLVGRYEQPPLPNNSQLQRHQQRFADFQFGFFDDSNDSECSLQRGRSRRRSRSISPTRGTFDANEQDTSLISENLLHSDEMTPPLSYQVPPQAPRFRRTMSLTNVPVRHSTSSAPVMMDLPLFPNGKQGRQHSRSISMSLSQASGGRRSSHTPAAPVFDPEATHYQDPEARKKLRMFLASPQKFDEAVEFGFPSTAGDDTFITPRYHLPPITTDARNFSKDMQTFLKDDRVSFLEDNEDDVDDEEDTKLDTDGESVTDMDSPVTPSSIGVSFRGHMRHASPSNFSSLDSSGLPALHPMGSRLNREMTLRMTLTRPDLRADEEQLYGWQTRKSTTAARDDPFALEELHFSDDMTGSKSPFAVKPKHQGNLVSRLFKRASKIGR